MDLTQQTLQAAVGLGGVGITKHLVQALVKPFVTDSRFYPLASVLLGTIWNVGLCYVLGLPLPAAALMGVLTGLSASGDYDSSKTMAPAPAPQLDVNLLSEALAASLASALKQSPDAAPIAIVTVPTTHTSTLTPVTVPTPSSTPVSIFGPATS